MWTELLNALTRPQPVVIRSLRLTKRKIDFYQVADPNAFADALPPETFQEDERFPYWAELWPSGVALASFVLRSEPGRGVDALELGCGLGLAGVAAALTGAHVTFTDFEPKALAFARANHGLNLGWPGTTRLLDWRHPESGVEAPLVLASDVLYERRFLDPFIATLRHSVTPGGRALVAEPGRAIAQGTVEILEREGFERDLHLEEIEVAGKTHEIWIHELRRNG